MSLARHSRRPNSSTRDRRPCPVTPSPRLVDFQLKVADGWIRESNVVPMRFQFIGYFMAFNALYWLWSRIDNVTKPPLGIREIEHLVGKVGENKNTATGIIKNNAEFVRLLAEDEERGPIRSMNTRGVNDDLGDDTEGRKQVARMLKGDPRAQLKGLAVALYLIRCNLVHGSKLAEEKLPEMGVAPLLELTTACLDYTKANRPA